MKKTFLLLGGLALAGFGCAKTVPTEPVGTATQEIMQLAPAGLAVSESGPADAHCANVKPLKVDPKICNADENSDETSSSTMDMPTDAPISTASSTSPDCQNADPEYGAIMYGTRGDDDDCKYHVEWSVAQTGDAQHATFTLTATNLADGKPVTGAAPEAELFTPCNPEHHAPMTDATSTEISPGTYTIGPVALDASGRWAVRFHFFDECLDAPTSPHGHAAFYINVP